MKRAYVDISLEGLADLLMVSFDPHRCEIEKFEQSPKYENCIRLHLAGDSLPVEDNLSSEETPNIKLEYTKEWITLDDQRIAQKTKLEIVPGPIDMRMVKRRNLALSNKGRVNDGDQDDDNEIMLSRSVKCTITIDSEE